MAFRRKKLGSSKIGTTGNGIGPCYTDKAARIGFRMADLLEEEEFAARLKVVLAEKNEIITKIYGGSPSATKRFWKNIWAMAGR